LRTKAPPDGKRPSVENDEPIVWSTYSTRLNAYLHRRHLFRGDRYSPDP
jgi:hypothetical protein